MKHLSKNQLDILINIVIVITTAIAVLSYFFAGPDALGSQNAQCLKYFTTDSNILAAAGSLLFLLFGRSRKLPHWMNIVKFVGTVSVTITLLTVVFFLAPMAARRGGFPAALRLFENNVFVLHFLTPVLSILSTVVLEKDLPLSRREAVWGLAPTVVYGFVYLVMVVYVKKWYDWYGFTLGGHDELIPLVMAVMFLGTLVVALIEQRLKSSRKGGRL